MEARFHSSEVALYARRQHRLRGLTDEEDTRRIVHVDHEGAARSAFFVGPEGEGNTLAPVGEGRRRRDSRALA